jgi:hypothetical protein
MKKLLLLTLITLAGCTKIDVPMPINLGKVSTSTAINKVTPIVSNGNITVEMNVTPEAKYSLQVTDLLDNEIKTFGFTADKDIYTKQLDLTSLKNGDYNLVLIDIAGKETKTNIIIKK